MFEPVRNQKVYELVIEQIKTMIVSGELKRGDRLPPERELVEQLRVSRTSVREAMRALQIIGLVECRQGGGNYIRESFEGNLIEPLSLMFTLSDSQDSEILELRKVLEVETVMLAARNITEQELAEMGKLIDRMKQQPGETENVLLDKEFHFAIARASRNKLILSIFAAVSSLMDSFIKDAREAIINQSTDKDSLIVHHQAIHEALIRGDGEAAASIMKDHMDMIIRNMALY